MAGTIIVDRIESDASYASTINVAAKVTFSNTVNFGVSSVAPVAGVYSPTTNNLAFTTASTERMRIDSAGNVGIGTSSPSGKLNVISGSVAQLIIGFNATSASYLDSDAIVFRNAATTEAGRFTSTGLFQFNSGYGSSATVYGCRAWVNFNGQGTPAIRASGNVSSITDNGVGNYTVNFATAMPDTNYAVVTGQGNNVAANDVGNLTHISSTSSVPYLHYETSVFRDVEQLFLAVFR